ncbi:hypothetical protein OF377_01150 [Ureaplasma sp. ES3154-GEN]|uniref:hypothetical protein n=1 Tax=Ureaplasma sp. ES3154-GEN TaxID=2984844 RepID=UPI0021E6FBF5|nr:hypothetical protein [Ureaplasma sp. ES3154-GEN]MCV3743494.1 hypothetical protein [Ureaplasma sp. ES3154-GEN]
MKKKNIIIIATGLSVLCLGIGISVGVTQTNESIKRPQIIQTPLNPTKIINELEKKIKPEAKSQDTNYQPVIPLTTIHNRVIKAASYADDFINFQPTTYLHLNQRTKVINNVSFRITNNESKILKELQSIDLDIRFVHHFLFGITNQYDELYISNLLTKKPDNLYDIVFRPNPKNESFNNQQTYHLKFIAFLISVPSVNEPGVLLEKFVVWPLRNPLKINITNAKYNPSKNHPDTIDINQYQFSDYSDYNFKNPGLLRKENHSHSNEHHH